jgi:hypothetical protein
MGSTALNLTLDPITSSDNGVKNQMERIVRVEASPDMNKNNSEGDKNALLDLLHFYVSPFIPNKVSVKKIQYNSGSELILSSDSKVHRVGTQHLEDLWWLS